MAECDAQILKRLAGGGWDAADLEAIARSPVWPNQIRRQRTEIMGCDAGLLVPIGIELDAPLLHQQSAEMLRGIKRVPGKITFHGMLGF
jgi:hypothetical protein